MGSSPLKPRSTALFCAALAVLATSCADEKAAGDSSAPRLDVGAPELTLLLIPARQSPGKGESVARLS